MFKREDIQNMLRNGVSTVVFTKKDGTERVMKCTLDENIIPHETNTNDPIDFPKEVKQPNLNVLAVFDVEKQGWRSFTIANVKSVQ